MSRTERLLRYLDTRPRAMNAAAGIGLGIGVPLIASFVHPAAGLVTGTAVLGGSLWLGLAWQPVAVEPKNSLVRLRDFERTLGIEMISTPGGQFLMGSPESEEGRYKDEGPQRKVRVSGFAMMKVPVTQQLYQAVIGDNPSHFQGDEQRPVEQVSWMDAVRFCNKLSERAGLTPSYRIEALPVDEGEQAVPRVDWDLEADGYRLPTEAEWEYAARAGSRRAYYFGDDPRMLEMDAWFERNSQGRTQVVGQKAANKLGLHDIHGNVWEWCWDWYHPYAVTNDKEVDLCGPATGDSRVVRGGSFGDEPRDLRSASRGRNEPNDRFWSLGLRCVRGGIRKPSSKHSSIKKA